MTLADILYLFRVLILSLLDYYDNFSMYSSVCSTPVIIPAGSEGNPYISVMIPTFRRPELLKESIRSALDQDIQLPFEVVVVDNGSEPWLSAEIDKIISDFNDPNLRLFRNPENIGMFGNWNRCIELARGRWLTILNDDDILNRNYLSTCMKEVGRYPDICMISCDVCIKDERTSIPFCPGYFRRLFRSLKSIRYERRWKGRVRKLGVAEYFSNNPHMGSLGILFRKDIAISLGGFCPDLYPSADYLFFTRFAINCGSYRLAQSLGAYRVSQNESQREDVIVGWMEKDMHIRAAIAAYMGGSNSILLKLYIKLAAIDTVRSGFKYWNKDIQPKVLLNRIGLMNFPANFARRVLGAAVMRFYGVMPR